MEKKINQYDQLLNYLENYNKKQIKKPDNIEKVNTKKLLNKANFHEYVPPTTLKKKHGSLGFDVDKFENIMRSKLIEEHKKRQSYERNYISVTELYTCLRQCFYNRMKYEVNLNKQYNFSYLYLINKVGNEIHTVVSDLYDFSETEKTIISEKYKTKGRVDAIKDNFIYEIKSIDESKFENKYIVEHYYQGLIYAYILNTEYNYQINTITIIYVSRNLKNIVPFDIPIDNKLAETLLKRALLLKQCLLDNKVIDPIGAIEEMCKYCSFKKQCEKDKYDNIKPPYIIIKKNEIKQTDIIQPKKVKKENTEITFIL